MSNVYLFIISVLLLVILLGVAVVVTTAAISAVKELME